MSRKGPTKATLEYEVKRLTERNAVLEMENKLIKQYAMGTNNTVGGYMSAMIIALEKTTEAVAHVLNDLKTIPRR